jgi:Fur family ferric uptake transcriptional regulator
MMRVELKLLARAWPIHTSTTFLRRTLLPSRSPMKALSRYFGGRVRVTGNRRAILQVLLEAGQPLSLEKIQNGASQCGKGDEAPNFATVFRMMASLEQLKLARKVHLGRSSSHFELTDSRHHRDHLVCTDCGQVTSLEGLCPVERQERQIARRHGFTDLTHSLEFFDRCGDCSAKALGRHSLPRREPTSGDEATDSRSR